MAKPKNLARIHVAAIYFAQESRDINKVAAAFGVSTRTIRRWSKEEPAWEEAIKAWESRRDHTHHVDRRFETKPKRNARRDTGQLFDDAEKAYKTAIHEGVASHKLASRTAEMVGEGLTRRRVHEWARLYHWRETDGSKTQEEHPPDKEKQHN